MAQNKTLTQSQDTLLKSYTRRLKDDIKSILDNFTEILKSSKIESETQVARMSQSVQDQYEIQVRAANIVRAGESLMRLISDIKEYLILNDFSSVNDGITERTKTLQQIQEETDRKLLTLKEDLSAKLHELEESYYTSRYR